MRRAENNPTERIIRLLDAWDEMAVYVATLETKLAEAGLIEGLPPRPDVGPFNLEIQRQQLTRARVIKARRYQQRVRAAASGVGSDATSFKQLKQDLAHTKLTPERMAEIDAMLASEMSEADHIGTLSPQFDNQTSGQSEPLHTGDDDAAAAAEGKFKL